MKLKIIIEGDQGIGKNHIANAIIKYLVTSVAPIELTDSLIVSEGKITKWVRAEAKKVDVVIICKCKKPKL